VRKVTQEDVDRIEDPSLKSWVRHLMKNGEEIPENDAERFKIAQQEMDDEIFKLIANILGLVKDKK